MATEAPPGAVPDPPRFAAKRVLVLYEHGRSGEAVIDLARDLVQEEQAALTVVSIVPTAPSGSRCGGSALQYNEVVRDTVLKELEEARRRLRKAADHAAFELLIEGHDPPLDEFAAAGGFGLVLLPARRRPLRSVKHPAAAALGRVAEIRIVDPRAPHDPHALDPRAPRRARANH